MAKMAQVRSFSFRKHCIDVMAKILNSSMILDLLQSSLHFQAKEKRYLLNMLTTSKKNIPALFEVFMGAYPLQTRKLAAHALHQLQPNLLQKHVDSVIADLMELCHFSFYFSNTLAIEPAFKNLFKTSFQEILNFMIETLGLAGKIEDPQVLVFSLRSTNEKTHAHAVETIEKTTSFDIFRYLEPLIDDKPLSEKVNSTLKFYPECETMGIEDILHVLSNSNQLIDQIAFALLAKKNNAKDWK